MGLAVLAIFSQACTTPTKRSQAENLQETGTLSAPIKDVLADVRRNGPLEVLEINPLEKHDKSLGQQKPTAFTVGMVEAFPLTLPIVDKLVEQSVQEIAYKELWTEKQTSEMIQKRKAALLNHMKGNSCFALSLSAPKDAMADLKYWYGRLSQDGKERPLRYVSNGVEALEDFRSMDRKQRKISAGEVYGRLNERKEVVACAPGKVDLQKEMRLVFEPRFRQGIQKAELVWKRPLVKVVE